MNEFELKSSVYILKRKSKIMPFIKFQRFLPSKTTFLRILRSSVRGFEKHLKLSSLKKFVKIITFINTSLNK